MTEQLANTIGSHQMVFPNEYLLFRELSHRIKNELTSAIGFISLEASRTSSDEAKTALSAVADLLHNYAGVHKVLQMPEYCTTMDAPDYLRTLCQSIRRARLNDREIDLVLIESPLQLRSDQCWKLGMIISELITNSARHAFMDRGGTIQVEMRVSGSYAQCRVMDNGSPPEFPMAGEGLKIVGALARDLSGRVEHQFGPAGATSILTFPIDW